MRAPKPSILHLVGRAWQSPWAWLPASLGALTTLGGSAIAASGADGSFLLFTGVSGVLLGVAAAATRLLTRTEVLATEIMREQLAEAAGETDRRQQLDRVRQVVGDARDAIALAKLDRLDSALRRMVPLTLQGATQDDRLPLPVGDRLGELWDRCLASLQRAAQLQIVSRTLSTSEARRKLAYEREQLLGDVDAALDRLEAALDHLQVAALTRGGEDGPALADLTDELDRGLAVARRVEQRLAVLERPGEDLERL